MGIIKKYLSLIKFSHTIFAMPFAMVGFFLAITITHNDAREWSLGKRIGLENEITNAIRWENIVIKFLLVILCMVFARSAAMAFNRYLDRSFDAKNPRTAIREIPAGLLKANSVLLFTIFCSLAFTLCTFFINQLCFFLSPVALIVVLGYSYTKRFTSLCHLVLGAGLSLAPVGAYIAVTGQFDILPILFSVTVLFWVSGFDIIYALQDEAFDKEHQLHSIPSLLGKTKALQVSRILHFLSAVCLIIAGFYGGFGVLYWIGAILFIGMLIYQQSIVKPTDLSRVNIAFMTANSIASVVFGVFVITDLFIH